MGDAASYLRDTLRQREAELTRTIQLVADLKATVIELADALEQCTHRSAELRAALTTEQQAREHDAVAADNALAEKDAQIAALTAQRSAAWKLLDERAGVIDNLRETPAPPQEKH